MGQSIVFSQLCTNRFPQAPFAITNWKPLFPHPFPRFLIKWIMDVLQQIWTSLPYTEKNRIRLEVDDEFLIVPGQM